MERSKLPLTQSERVERAHPQGFASMLTTDFGLAGHRRIRYTIVLPRKSVEFGQRQRSQFIGVDLTLPLLVILQLSTTSMADFEIRPISQVHGITY